jgi:hypothetical protein
MPLYRKGVRIPGNSRHQNVLEIIDVKSAVLSAVLIIVSKEGVEVGSSTRSRSTSGSVVLEMELFDKTRAKALKRPKR